MCCGLLEVRFDAGVRTRIAADFIAVAYNGTVAKALSS